MGIRTSSNPDHKGKTGFGNNTDQGKQIHTAPRWTGREKAILAALCLVAFSRGAYWSITLPIWHPIDESHHYAYAASIASGDGIPTVGRDTSPPEIFRIAKQHPRDATVPLPPEKPRLWGASGFQYEAIQPPLYYAAMAAVYKLSGPPGLTKVIVLRLATVTIALLALPITAAAAQELFPDYRVTRLAAPALLAILPAANGYGSYITNDAATLTAGAAVIWASARLWRRAPRPTNAAVLGLSLGLAFITRNSTVLLAPLALIALTGSLWRYRVRPRSAAAPLAAFGLVATAIALPWLVWTKVAYKGTSLAAEFAKLIEPIAGRQPRSFAGFKLHIRQATNGWFEFLWPSPPPTAFFFAAVAVIGAAVAGGLVAAIVRKKDPIAALALIWLATAVPFAVAGMFLIIQFGAGGVGGMLGRYLIFTLPGLALAVSAGLETVLGAHLAAIGLAVLAASIVTAGARAEQGYFIASYGREVRGSWAPVVDQSYNDGWVSPGAVRFEPPCEARAVSILFRHLPPAKLEIQPVGKSPFSVALTEPVPIPFGSFAVYDLPNATAERFRVNLPGDAEVGRSLKPRSGAVAFSDAAAGVQGSGDPVARIYCEVKDPIKTRFQQLNPLGRRLPVSYGILTKLPSGWIFTAWLAAGLTLALQILRRAKSPNPGGKRPVS